MIVITGQTATGKTDLAVLLAKKHDGELVNFDSRQIYKYLDIITGKDLPASKIHLYDIVTPDQYFSSFDYVQAATQVISKIIDGGKVPILVGGTYLYLKHLLYGFNTQAPPDFGLREKLNSESVESLQTRLKKIDAEEFLSMNQSDKSNPRRLIRRIEILSSKNTGEKVTTEPLISQVTEFIGVKYGKREDLVDAISKRVSKRLEEGAIDEVRSVLKKGYRETDPGMRTIGYQEIIRYLKGNITKEQAVTDWMIHEVQYAKRQYTFMKKDTNIKWREI